MWARQSHMLSPLTKITSNKVKFKWTKIEQTAFEEINPIFAHRVLLGYPNFYEEFKIHTDTSKFQLGEVVI